MTEKPTAEPLRSFVIRVRIEMIRGTWSSTPLELGNEQSKVPRGREPITIDCGQHLGGMLGSDFGD
jgi:hypothetical protein